LRLAAGGGYLRVQGSNHAAHQHLAFGLGPENQVPIPHSYTAACQRRRSGFVIMTNGDGGTRMWPRLLEPEMLARLAAQA
jgi:hypothetical protein